MNRGEGSGPIDLFDEVLTPDVAAVLARIGAQPGLGAFYMAGGTAAALQIGHRMSLDIDLFSERPWTWAATQPMLIAVGPVAVDRLEEGGFVGTVSGVRVSLFHYPYVLLAPPVPSRSGVPLADLLDIACMKIVAVAQRGSRKDFVDLYHMAMAGTTVREAIAALPRKTPGISYSLIHLAKSLVYFDDAEEEPDPVMLVEHDWRRVRRYFEAQADALLGEIEGRR